MSQHIAVLLLGSNIGIKEKNITTAISKLESAGCELLYYTDFLYSEAVEFDSPNIFCNIATSISMQFSPIVLLNLIKEIEQDMGRKLDSIATGMYNDRMIDIDIVSYNDISYFSKKLQIPHLKHLKERMFSKRLLNELETIEVIR